MKLKSILSLGAALASAALISCSPASTPSADASLGDTLTHHANYLTMVRQLDGSMLVDVASPWQQGQYLGRYLLVNVDSALPENIPADRSIIRTPISRAAVFSSVHTSAMDELGALQALVAVADAQYFAPTDTVSRLLHSGRLMDLGAVASPSLERLVASRAQAVLRSPLEGVAACVLPNDVEAVECADYLENSPLGRAEWILFLGQLFGKSDAANAIFSAVEQEYDSIASLANSQGSRPSVLSDTEYSGVWYVPGGKSYMAQMYSDAGAEWPWEDNTSTGNLPLSLESVAAKASEADVWLVKSYGFTHDSKSLLAQNPRYKIFKALQKKNVYVCDTQRNNIYNLAFHPERLLKEYVAIFHPAVLPDYQLKYFKRIE